MKIIADACNNHLGKWDNIRKMIDQLSGIGIDYIKFQIFTADKLNKNYPDYEKFYKLYKQCELDESMIKNIVLQCEVSGIEPLFTLFDVEKAYMLAMYSDIVKIASPDCNNWVLLDTVFPIFNKVIVSTGMHTLKEIEDMLEYYKKYRKKIVLMYCKSQYPADYSVADMNKANRIFDLSRKYGCEFGVSDHGTLCHEEADWYEHHFTLEKTGGPDDKVSWTIKEFADFMRIGDEYENRIKYKTRWV